MDKIYVNQRNKESAEVIMGNKLNELVKGYNEIRDKIERISDFLVRHRHHGVSGRSDITQLDLRFLDESQGGILTRLCHLEDKVQELIDGYNEIIKRLRRLEDEHCWNDEIKEIYQKDK